MSQFYSILADQYAKSISQMMSLSRTNAAIERGFVLPGLMVYPSHQNVVNVTANLDWAAAFIPDARLRKLLFKVCPHPTKFYMYPYIHLLHSIIGM